MTGRVRLWPLLIYLTLSWLLYFPVLGAFFVSDDFDWLGRAQANFLTLEKYFLSNIDAASVGGAYRPLTNLSFLINYKIGGLEPFSYHLINVIFHAFNSFFVFWLTTLLVKKEKFHWPAFLAGFFFVVLPNHAEAVSWIAGRNDVLVAFFYLLSLIFYVQARQRLSGWRHLCSLVFFGLALLAKEMAITLPLFLLVYEWLRSPGEDSWRSSRRRQFFYLSPFFLILFFYFLARFYATGLFYGFYAASSLNFSWRTAAEIFLDGLASNFTVGAARSITFGFLNRHLFWLAAVLPILFFILIKRLKEPRRSCLFGALFFLISLMPVYYLRLNSWTDEGERFVYLPSVGVVIILSFLMCGLISRSGRRRRLGILILILLAGYFSWSLWQKNALWGKAGELSFSLLQSFKDETALRQGEGTVILGLPDNIAGAQVFRNGWLSALALIHPSYDPDVLIVKIGLNLTEKNFDQKTVAWRPTNVGFEGLSLSSAALFSGMKELASLDYQMKIKGYQPRASAGSEAEVNFTPRFLNQLKNKKINFFAVEGMKLKPLFLLP